MAGYSYNYGTPQAPEYTEKPSADSLYGILGTNTPAARQNQQERATGGGGKTNPYAAFHDAPMVWNPPTKPAQPAAPAQPTTSPLASVLMGSNAAPPPAMKAQAATLAPSPAPQQQPALPPPPFHPDAIPPIPTLTTSSASTLAGVIQSTPEAEAQPSGAIPASGATAGIPGGTPGPTPLQQQATPEVQIPDGQPAPSPSQPVVPVPPTAAPTGGTRERAVAPPQVTPGTMNTGNDTHDAGGMPYGPQNPPPKPPGTEDSEVAASWYRKFQYLDPSYANITGGTVTAYRTSGFQGSIAEWLKAGGPTPAQTPTTPPATTPTQPSGGNAWIPTAPPSPEEAQAQFAARRDQGLDFKTWYAQTYPNAPAPTPEMAPQASPAAAAPPTTPAPPSTPPTAPAPPEAPAAPWNPTVAGGQTPTDIADIMGKFYGPQFERQQSDLARVLRAQGALTGKTDSGGFNESLDRNIALLAAQQGGQLAEHTEAALNRASQLAIAQMQDATQRYGIKTNADLQRWLNSADSDTITKLGIDKNDLLQRYLGQLGIDKAKIDANAAISAAQLHAAAASAAANAGAGAALAKIASEEKMFGMSNTLDWAKLQAGLYQGDQNAYITELGYLINAGITPDLAAKIAGAFGPNPPVYVQP